VTVAVEPLVIARKPAQARRRARCGDRAFLHPGDRRGVVREVLEGGVADVMSIRHEVDLVGHVCHVYGSCEPLILILFILLILLQQTAVDSSSVTC
jgi:hypothetical protein